MTGIVATIDGSTVLKSTHSGLLNNSEAIAMKIHDDLTEKGAKEILEEIRRNIDPINL